MGIFSTFAGTYAEIMKTKLTSREYLVPFILITSLFFLWGFARAILDVLNQHFRDTMDISIAQSSLIQVTTYLGYFLMAVPAGMFINRYGYKRGVVMGLLLYAVGALLFIPGVHVGTLPAFLVCLFIIACGLAILETAANPYATELGPSETAAARLNFSQSFNGLGSCLAPILVGSFLFSGGDKADVSLPYMVMGVLVILVAIVFSFSKLPTITTPHDEGETNSAVGTGQSHSLSDNLRRLVNNRMFVLGVLALFCYEVAEISINSYFVLFVTGQGWLTATTASAILSGALLIFMLGRFVGSWVMQRVSAERTLTVCAFGCVLCMVGVIVSAVCVKDADGWQKYLPLAFLIANYFFESIMFPTIFSLAIGGLGTLTKTASSILMMTPVGGCAFLLVGLVADHAGFIIPFVIPLLGYVVVWAYARAKQSAARLPVQ